MQMAETTLNFSTTLNCINCLNSVKPGLDKMDNIKEWNVDLSKAEKILTVEGEKVNSKEIIKHFEKMGFECKPLN
jgi:copper chaperone